MGGMGEDRALEYMWTLMILALVPLATFWVRVLNLMRKYRIDASLILLSGFGTWRVNEPHASSGGEIEGMFEFVQI